MVLIYLGMYLLLCTLNGVMGRHTVIGFFGYFIMSLILTPIFGFIIVLIARPARRPVGLTRREG